METMGFYEFCREFDISVAKAKKMEKRGVLRLRDGGDDRFDEIKFYLGRGQQLPLKLLLLLLEDPTVLWALGRHVARAERQLKELGDVQGEAAPKEVSAYILSATDAEPEGVQVIVDWLRSIIPATPVSYHWIAVRLLWGVPQNIRKYDIPRVPIVIAKCRIHPDLKSWWRTEKMGNRTRSIFQRPEGQFDL